LQGVVAVVLMKVLEAVLVDIELAQEHLVEIHRQSLN
jgi:hypothetical protein